jgi:hypothetical protein
MEDKPHATCFEHYQTSYQTHLYNKHLYHSKQELRSQEPRRQSLKQFSNEINMGTKKYFSQQYFFKTHSKYDSQQTYSFTRLRIFRNICSKTNSRTSFTTRVNTTRRQFMNVLEKLGFTRSRITNK